MAGREGVEGEKGEKGQGAVLLLAWTAPGDPTALGLQGSEGDGCCCQPPLRHPPFLQALGMVVSFGPIRLVGLACACVGQRYLPVQYLDWLAQDVGTGNSGYGVYHLSHLAWACACMGYASRELVLGLATRLRRA